MSTMKNLRHAVFARSPMLKQVATRIKWAIKQPPAKVAPAPKAGTATVPLPKVYHSARAQRPIGLFSMSYPAE